MLPDKDSNPDTQNQNLPYYHYTIGQFRLLVIGNLEIGRPYS